MTQVSPGGLSPFQRHQCLSLSICVCVSPQHVPALSPLQQETPEAAHGTHANIYHFAGIDYSLRDLQIIQSE